MYLLTSSHVFRMEENRLKVKSANKTINLIVGLNYPHSVNICANWLFKLISVGHTLFIFRMHFQWVGFEVYVCILRRLSVLQEQQFHAAHFLIHPPQLKSIGTKGHLHFFFCFQVCQLLATDGNTACTLLRGTHTHTTARINPLHSNFIPQLLNS